MSTAPYSREFTPPAPVLPVNLAIPAETPKTGTFAALVDTGADGTFVPTAILEELDLPVLYMTNVRSHLGEKLHRVSVHIADIILFDTIRLPNIEVVSDDWGNRIIIGRNVLNMLRLHLDGPREVMKVLE